MNEYESIERIAELNLLNELCKKIKRTLEEEAMYRHLLTKKLKEINIGVTK